MNRGLKTTLFLAVAGVIIMGGIFIIFGAGNRGSEPEVYLRFDEGYGSTAYDSSGNNDGAITGATWAQEDDCKTGECLYFDGSGDYVSVPDFSLE